MLVVAIAECVMTVGITEMLQLCAVKWDSQDMVSDPCLLACPVNRHLLCTGAIAVDGSSFTGSTSTPFISSVGCVGNESSLFSCPLYLSPKVCNGKPRAGVACQGTS